MWNYNLLLPLESKALSEDISANEAILEPINAHIVTF